MKPLISIITPLYNAKEFVAEGVQSVKNQTLEKKFFEWIILDDGSKDDSGKIIADKISDLDNAHLFTRNKNLGTSVTRNQAVNLSKGRYLAFFDVDDLLENKALELTLNFMESNPEVDFSYSKHTRIDSKGNFICKRDGTSYSREKLLHYNFIGHLKCINRKIHDSIRGFDENFGRYSEDYDYTLRASEILGKKGIKQNPEYLYKYRIHGSNNMANISMMQSNAIKAIQNSLRRKEKKDVSPFWSHKEGLYNYYDWEKK